MAMAGELFGRGRQVRRLPGWTKRGKGEMSSVKKENDSSTFLSSQLGTYTKQCLPKGRGPSKVFCHFKTEFSTTKIVSTQIGTKKYP